MIVGNSREAHDVHGIEAAIGDLRDFFTNDNHWIYHSKGTPSLITPDSLYHITQLQVLFENKHFHPLTYRAIQELRQTRFLRSREVTSKVGRSILVWRSGIRYVERQIKAHMKLVEEYSSELINKATGDYAETLVLSGLSRLHLSLVGRNTRVYRDRTWTQSDHNLDFIMEKGSVAYGIEVKNTFDYMPADEFAIKLQMCQFLGIRPLFVVRSRDKIQWQQAKDAGGLIFMFKTKIFPPGQDPLVHRIWQEMRLPVGILHDWRSSFYDTIRSLLKVGNNS